MLNLLRITVTGVIFLFFLGRVLAQEANYDEAKVTAYTLPDPLMFSGGKKITQAKTWTSQRRREILTLFREHMYGKSPGKPAAMRFEVMSADRDALGGKATRKEIRVHFSGKEDGPRMDILIYLPNHVKRPPLFL